MEGIERITNKILEDAKAQVSRIEAETEEYEKEQMEDSRRMHDRVLAESREKANEEAVAMVQRAESLASSERRKYDLARNQADVQRIIDQAVEKLLAESPDKKVDRYVNLINSHGIEEGIITLSEREKELGPALVAALPQGKFTIADTPGKMRGGIIISHGNIEENLTYDLIIHNNMPRLSQLAQEQINLAQSEGETND